MCDSGVACCQSKHQCHFWRMNSMFRSVLKRQVSLAAVNQIHVIHEAMKGCSNLKIHFRLCFENVNIIGYKYDEISIRGNKY